MDFRRSGERDERRRRLLQDAAENSTPGAARPEGAADPAAPVKARAVKGYGEAGLNWCRKSLADLVPRRPLTIVILSLLAGCLVAGLVYLDALSMLWTGPMRGEDMAALSLSRYGALGSWFASLTLMCAAMVAALIYAIRRHRQDDYRGRYRVWVWAIVALLIASSDAAAGWHSALGAAIARIGGSPDRTAGPGWWMLIFGAFYGLLGARLLFEIRHSRGSLAALLAAGCCYGGSLLCQPGVLAEVIGPAVQWWGTLTALLAHLLVLLSVTLFARNVVLDAFGLLPKRKRRVKSRKSKAAKKRNKPDEAAKEEKTTAGGKSVRVDSAHSTPSPAGGVRLGSMAVKSSSATSNATAARSSYSSSADDDEDDDSDSSSSGMSRAERKRLKKLQKTR